METVESSWGVGLASIDIGNRNFKLVGDNDTFFVAPSMLAMWNDHSSDQPGYTDRVKFDADPNWYLVGENILEYLGTSQPTLFNVEARYWSPQFLKMVLYGLFRVYVTHPKELHTPKITISLPASIFKDVKKLKDVKDNLTGKHTVIAYDGKKEIRYRFDLQADLILLRPEGAGTFAGHMMQEVANASEPRWSKNLVAVASWGYLTCSCILFDNGIPVKGWYKSNSAVGMRQVVGQVAERYGNPLNVNEFQWEEAVVGDGEASLMGRPLKNFKVQRLMITQSIAENGLIWLSNVLSTSGASYLLFVGGTVEYFDKVLPVPFWNMESVRNSLPENVHKSYNPLTDDAAGHYLRQAYQRGASL